MKIAIEFDDGYTKKLDITESELDKINVGKRFIVATKEDKEYFINTQKVNCLISNENIFKRCFDEY